MSSLLAMALVSPIARGQDVWEWPESKGIGVAGSQVLSMGVWNDGSGPGLYVGGLFSQAGGIAVDGIARWSGKEWSALPGSGAMPVEAIIVFDDGQGAALFAGGSTVARWNGAMWAPVGGGATCCVHAFAVWNDGTGDALFVGGADEAGGKPVNGLAKWDGKTWSKVGGGVDVGVSSLAVYDDGTGPSLFVGGIMVKFFSPTDYWHVAKWDGRAWAPLGSGTNDRVHAMQVFDDGSGAKLFVSGDFTTAGGIASKGMARWDGKAWTNADAGLNNGDYRDFAIVGSQPKATLYACGGGSAASWRNGFWDQLPQLPGSGTAYAGAGFDDGSGMRLHVGGASIGLPNGAKNIARLKQVIGGGPCGDLTGDGFVNQQDLGILLGDFGCTAGIGLCPGDCDGDGDTDQADLGILLANWEKPCP
ncbi:MAG TPA: hypothetical protein VNO52_03575 [Methylomirabilota bacterium]|nr:hypothetical protein [Methylomirabilota bacterium]